MHETSFLLLVSAAVIVVMAAVLMLLETRHRRRIRALLERLAELEGDAGAVKGETSGGAVPAEAVDDARPDDDVLAGRTTYVRRLIEGGPDGITSLADQAILRIHERLEHGIQPADLAAALFVSLRTLERGLAGSLGCTPRQLILAVRMREARRLLETGRYTVTEVAFRVGFANSSHFSQRFAVFYRTPPSAVIPRRAA